MSKNEEKIETLELYIKNFSKDTLFFKNNL